MADFKDASLWMKLAMLVTCLGFALCLYGMDTPGWASFVSTCTGSGSNRICTTWYSIVEACAIVSFLTLLTALFLVLCLDLLDELKGNKPALICYIVFAFIAGLVGIVGVAIFGANTHGSSSFSIMITCYADLCVILGGIFGILEVAGVSA